MNDSIEVRVYYEDTDCGGVVYYGKYLSYLERARTDFFDKRGIDLLKMMNDGIYFVVVHVDIHYRKSARYGDILLITSELEKVTQATVVFRHTITLKNSDTVISTSKIKLACVNRESKPVRLGKELLSIGV